MSKSEELKKLTAQVALHAPSSSRSSEMLMYHQTITVDHNDCDF